MNSTGSPPPPAAQPPAGDRETLHAESPAAALIATILEDMGAAFDRGENPRADDYLERLPGLDEDDAVRIVYEEASLRQEAGEAGVSDEVYARYPQWRDRLGPLFECNRLFREHEARFPGTGETLGDFTLLAELGRGATGRTFLARQGSLADRPIVLKVMAMAEREHLSLARLQHMNIVPLYFEQALPERNLRLLGMPYLAGASFDRVLEGLAEIPVSRRSGADLVAALDRGATAVPAADLPPGPFRKHLERESFVRAVCWIGVCLADALQVAHARGLIHLDVKPSNVLLAGDGQPMLLDFHLARAPLAAGAPAPERLGGTRSYASPEQLAAMEAVSRGAKLGEGVDGRSDVYSLGLLLDEALRGMQIDGPNRSPLDRANPNVSRGLSDIIARCLARSPSDRYQDASALASDLRRHLADRPLLGVANRSPRERWEKWRRREPSALGRLALRAGALLAVSGVVAFAIFYDHRRVARVDAALAEGRQLLDESRHAEAAAAFRRGLSLVSSFRDDGARRVALSNGLARAVWLRTTRDLHEVVDLYRFRAGVAPSDPDEARSLLTRGDELWRSRQRFTSPPSSPDLALVAESARADLVDLATILADLRVRSVALERDGRALALQGSVRLLEEAEADYGSSLALKRDLREYRRALGLADVSSFDLSAPRTPFEHYDLGRSYLRSADYARAEAEFRRSIDLQPTEFWPHYYHGIAAFRLGRYADSAASFSTCLALSPRTAECYYNRALALAAQGQTDRALADDTRALELNPRFADASLNRAVILIRARRFDDALRDLDTARQGAHGPATLGLIDYNHALIALARGDRTAARACLESAAARGVAEARKSLDDLDRNVSPRPLHINGRAGSSGSPPGGR